MTKKTLRHFFNYQVGKLAAQLGYTLKPSWKERMGNMNPVALAVAALFSDKPLNLVIQIGAFDGELHDPLQGKILNVARAAILVEPQPKVAAALRERYREVPKVRILEAAIASSDGTAILYSDSEFSPKASLHSEHLERFGLASQCQTTVQTLTPKSLVALAGGNAPDLLQIDTEGMDWKILLLFLETGIRPAIINFEHLHLSRGEREASRRRLGHEGYTYLEWGWDTLAVRSDDLSTPST